jgi:large subunit ribosomal protein L35
MPKMKTHSGTKKRFRVTASGKLKYRGAGLNHINAKKKQERKKRIGGSHYVDPTMVASIKRLLRIG